MHNGRENSSRKGWRVRRDYPLACIRLLRAIDRSLIFDERDVIFVVDGERIRNILELADRVQSLARGNRKYLTLARRGRRVQICVTASP